MAFLVPKIKIPLVEEFLQSEKIGWLSNFRQSAYRELLLSDFPNTSMEMWRKFPFGNFDPLDFSFYKDEIKPTSSPKGVLIRDFRELKEDSLDRLSEILQNLLVLSKGDFFRNFLFSFFTSGTFIEIEKSHQIQDPVFIQKTVPKNQNSIFPLIIVLAKENSDVKIVEEMIAKENEEMTFVHSFTAVFQENSSQLTYVTKESFSDSVFHIRNFLSNGKKDSNLKNFYINLGGYKGKTIIESNLLEKGSFVETYGAFLLAKREFLDTDVQISHDAGHTESKLLMKVVAKEKAHNIFTGNLNIPKSSEKVTASQLSRNLIMDKTARAEAIPKLEVFSHDVKCSHGASVGEIGEDILFYLLSRGLTEQEARFLVVEGFLSEILDKLPDVERDLIQNTINEKLFQK